jgi:hypothetical protein
MNGVFTLLRYQIQLDDAIYESRCCLHLGFVAKMRHRRIAAH